MFSRLHHKMGKALPEGTVIHKDDIEELHFITPIENLSSIMEHGILSHQRAARIVGDHSDVSDSAVQRRRASVMVPRVDVAKGRLKLHRHANLYLNAHNAMMYVRKEKHESLCVLRIRREVLDRGDAVLTTRNAATDAVSFFSPTTKDPLYSPRSTGYLTVERVYGRDEEGKQIRQSEVLLPYQVDPSYIGGVFVSCDDSRDMAQGVLESISALLPIEVHPSLFFHGRTHYVPLEAFTPLPSLTTEQLGRLHAALPDSSPESSDTEADGVAGPS